MFVYSTLASDEQEGGMRFYIKAVAFLIVLLWVASPTLAEERDKHTFYADGWHIKADLLSPTVKNNRKLPLVIMLNKAGGDRKTYHAFARRLLDKGFASLRVDLRGHGESINKGRFDHIKLKNFEVLEDTYKDIAVITQWARGSSKYNAIALIGASYSGEHMMLAAETGGFADAYIALSPGSFSDTSIDKVDASRKPWFFVRAQKELPFFDDIFAKIKERSKTAKIQIVEGSAHASDMLIDNPALEDDLITWLTLKLK